MATIRAFIAAQLLGSTRSWITSVQSEISKVVGSTSLKLIPHDQLHITLIFLGEIDTRLIPKVVTSMENFSPTYSIEVNLNRLGQFSRNGAVSVAWVGIEKCGLLNDYYSTLIRYLGQFLTTEPASFKPHLTLARVRPGIDPEANHRLIKFIEKKRVDLPMHDKIDEIVLFRSDLKPSGPIYTRLHTIRLQDGIQ